ncbi:MAG TPA: GH92 family glycosyl hydrolase [Verrucomicrobiae bacterium]|nr:GH92 family glycosyl hydrolase [Verrucomicrobiae bacterium]
MNPLLAEFSSPFPRRALLLLACGLMAGPAFAQDPVDEVDPSIGNVGQLLEPTRPTVSLPNSMVRVYPVRRDGLDDCIQSFPLTIISHRLGELFWVMPAPQDKTACTEPVPYDQEKSTPYYYRVRFDESAIKTEFTPAARSGFFRFGFPDAKGEVIVANREGGEMQAEGEAAFSGVEQFHNMAAYVYGEFSQPVIFAQRQSEGKTTLIARGASPAAVLQMRYGISFISVAQARMNLREEIASWDFDRLEKQARDRWNEALGQVKVEGGTAAQRRVFYTALYRCYERMVNISEDGQYYSSFDHQTHQDARPFYVDNWIWDTHRALEPLQTLLNPVMEADKVQSYVRMYQQGAWMPSFAVLWGNHPCMTGNHAAAWMADVWFKGVTNFDVGAAYEGLRKNSLERTFLPWRYGPKCALDDFYNAHGYMPALAPGQKETVSQVHPFERRQAVAVTLGHSYDDWCTAQLARVTGHEAEHDLFLRRAAFYKNVYRADKGFVWPKDEQGNWIEPFDPKFSGGLGGRDYTTENSAYTYNWDVPHDYRGLFELMGGPKAASAKLDQLFRADLGRSKSDYFAMFPDSTGLVGQFVMGNEPSLAIPYLYNHLGQPWKTQKRVRQLLDFWFTDTHLGIPGDEDGGGLSAFVVFSMMGFYPVVPGEPMYELGSPAFDRVTIRLAHGKTLRLNCRNNSVDNKYIKSARLNGQPQERLWFSHREAVDGLTIDLEMSNSPSATLGVAPETWPPSDLNLDPATLRESAPTTAMMSRAN